MTPLQAMKQALEALNKYAYYDTNKGYRCVACNTLHINSHLEWCPMLIAERNLRTAIEEMEKAEPVAWVTQKKRLDRKRAAIQKANNEADFQRQRALMAEHHANVMQGFAEVAARKADVAARKADALQAQLDALHAQLDALMLEFCPEEMTDAQKENWARHQRPASDEMQASVATALMGSNAELRGAGTASAGLPGSTTRITER